MNNKQLHTFCVSIQSNDAYVTALIVLHLLPAGRVAFTLHKALICLRFVLVGYLIVI